MMSIGVGGFRRKGLAISGRQAMKMKLLGTAAIAFVFVYGGLAQAQVTPGADEKIEEVVVTGSRIARRDFVADSPIVTVGAKALESVGDVSLESKLNQLPQFAPGATQFASNIAGTGLATLNLRNLGDSRNLVLLDGHRMQPANATLSIDVNALPSVLIQDVEVISGGASAVYGSDAISGVVNFKLKKRFDGIQIDSQYGVSDRGDGVQKNLSIMAGSKLADDKGRVLFAAEYYDRDSIFARDRSFYSRAFGAGGGGTASNTLPTGTYNPTAGNLPSQAALNTVFSSYGVTGSVTPATILGFNTDGSLFTDNNSVRNYKGPGAEGGYSVRSNVLVYDPNVEVELTNPMERYTAFGRFDYKFNDNLNFFTQFNLADYTSYTNGSGTLAQGTAALSVPVSNPFVPSDLRTILTSRPTPGAAFTVTKRFTEAGRRVVEHDVNLYQLSAGLSGRIDGTSLSWDIFASHGKTKIDDSIVGGGVLASAVQTLLNAADGGASLCQGGLDIFGTKGISQSCLNYITRNATNRTSLTQDAVEATLQGKAFDLPAGEVRFAVGTSYRREKYDFIADANLTANPTQIIGFNAATSTSGATEVKEVYAEVLFPLLKDLPFIKSLDLNTAYRYSDYDITGGVKAYKADFNWAIVDSVRLRGGYQRAVRAPNIGELFQGAYINYTNLGSAPSGGDPCDIRSSYRLGANAAQVRSLCIAQGVSSAIVDSYTSNYNQVPGTTSGNPNLRPETADTYTFGTVLTPKFDSDLFRRMSLSLDYYSIEITDAIGTITGLTMMGNCFNANNANPNFSQTNPFCSTITRNADGTIFELGQPYLNLGGYKTAGVDAQFDWRVPMNALGFEALTSSLNLNFVINYLDSFEIQALPSGAFVDYAGTVSTTAAYAKWNANTTLTYDAGGYSVGLRWKRLAAMDHATAVTNPTSVQPGTKAYNTFDLFARMSLNDKIDLRGGIDNLTDQAPLVVGSVIGTTNPSVFDPLGRRYYIGVRAKF